MTFSLDVCAYKPFTHVFHEFTYACYYYYFIFSPNLLATLPEGVKIERSEQHVHAIELFTSGEEPTSSDIECPYCGYSACAKKRPRNLSDHTAYEPGFLQNTYSISQATFQMQAPQSYFLRKTEMGSPIYNRNICV